MNALARAVATLASLAVALGALVRLGSGALSAPPVGSWAAASRWYDDVGPDVAMVAGLRIVAVGLGAWLLVATLLQILGSLPALAPVGAVADLISPRSLQRLGHGLAGLSLTAGLAAPAPSAGFAEPPLPPAGTATMHLVPDQPEVEVAPPPAPVAAASPSASTVVAAAGDSLWSIAAEELAPAGGGPPDEREVAAYWRRLIEANRSVLVDPANPDLIYPGQVFTLP